MTQLLSAGLSHRAPFAGVLCALLLGGGVVGCANSNSATITGERTMAQVTLDAPVKAPAAPPEVPPFDARKLFDLADARIDESSGIAASRRYPGLLWTHNDSGDSARLFLVATSGAHSGKTIAEVKLEGATATDWEDMAVAGAGKDAWVYAADIGDNLRKRSEVVIYRFREPEVDTGSTAQILTLTPEKMTLTYPDGAHDAETLIATTSSELIIVSKVASGESVIFKTPQPFTPDARQQLVKIGEYKFDATGVRSRLTTGGDLSPDGRHVVVRTYTRAYQWALPPEIKWTKVWPGTPEIWTLPETVQGEAICYSADGQKIYTSSEQLPAPVYELSLRAEP